MCKLLGARDLASLLGVSPRKLEQMIDRGEVPVHVKFGRTRKWRADHIQQWLDTLFADQENKAE